MAMKDVALALVDKMTKGKEEPSVVVEVDEPSEEYVAVAEEAMQAMQDNDAVAFADALRAFVKMC